METIKIRLLDVSNLGLHDHYENGDVVEVKQYYTNETDWWNNDGRICILYEDEYEFKENIYWERVTEGDIQEFLNEDLVQFKDLTAKQMKLVVRSKYVKGMIVRWYNCDTGTWVDHTNITVFSPDVAYQVTKENQKPSVDWSCIKDEYKYLTVSLYGHGYVSIDEPTIEGTFWQSNSGMCDVYHLASFNAGNVDWKDSLVERPD